MNYFCDNIDKMQGYTPGFQPKDADVVKLNTNENPYPPSPKVIEAISQLSAEQLRRYPEPLADKFRDAAAKVLGVKPENIMCTNGGDELLNMAFRAFCDKDRRVAYPVPTYSLYPVLAEIQNCETIEVPFDKDFNLPSGLAKTGAALTIVCNPNAPSGSFVEPAELAELADEIKGVLLIDEAYVDFAEQDCVSLIENFDNVIILRSMSKGYSLAGVRFGYAVASKNLIDGMLKLKDSYNVDVMAITAATAAISDRQYFKQCVEKIKEQRAELSKQLRELGFKAYDSSSNFVFCEHIKAKGKDIFNKLVSQNIFVRYWDIEGIDNYLRITVGTAEQNKKLIAALKQILA